MFYLDSKLIEDTIKVTSLELSELLIMNNKNYPWLILVPRIEAVEIIDLSFEDIKKLYSEIKIISNLLKSIYPKCKLNIASIGNIVSQLHIHIIARHKEDLSWPGVVFGKVAEKYSEGEALIFMKLIKEKLNIK